MIYIGKNDDTMFFSVPEGYMESFCICCDTQYKQPLQHECLLCNNPVCSSHVIIDENGDKWCLTCFVANNIKSDGRLTNKIIKYFSKYKLAIEEVYVEDDDE